MQRILRQPRIRKVPEPKCIFLLLKLEHNKTCLHGNGDSGIISKIHVTVNKQSKTLVLAVAPITQSSQQAPSSSSERIDPLLHRPDPLWFFQLPQGLIPLGELLGQQEHLPTRAKGSEDMVTESHMLTNKWCRNICFYGSIFTPQFNWSYQYCV